MPRVFITGISGQDGSYLADLLIAEGSEVHGLVRRDDTTVASLLSRQPGVRLHEGDLSETESLAGLIDQLEPDEIYNLAGISSVAQSWQIPVTTGIVTGIAVAGILDAAWNLMQRTGRPVRVLQASSSEIFGRPDRTPQDETTTVAPMSPYGAAKAYGHHIVGVYRQRGLSAASCILYNHESPRRPETFVTRKITMGAARIAAGKQDSIELGALNVRRDWGWAPDYADAMIRAVRHASPDDYVIATGTSHSVEEFVAAAFQKVGIHDWRAHVTVSPEFLRSGEIAEMRGDASKARRVLGWAPTVDFDGLVTRMIEEDVRLTASTQTP